MLASHGRCRHRRTRVCRSRATRARYRTCGALVVKLVSELAHHSLAKQAHPRKAVARPKLCRPKELAVVIVKVGLVLLMWAKSGVYDASKRTREVPIEDR
jgi:hypothetical protein